MPGQLSTDLTKELLASVLKEHHQAFLNKDLGVAREILGDLKSVILSPQIMVITGLRRVGKSTLLAQIAHKYYKNNYYFVNFEDERLLNFQVKDFDLLHETLINLYGEKKIFLFDEIQNVPQWERFVRRLHDQGFKSILTGSNASLLSQELGTRLTGRSVRIEVFPFSFREFMHLKRVEIPPLKVLTTTQRGNLGKLMNEYKTIGGIPDALKYPELEIHKTLYDDVLYRDVATRYKLGNIMNLKELALYLSSNPASLISYNKLKEVLKLGSVNTIKSYIGYLENSWLFFAVNKYAFSVKEQQIAAKKIYSIDTGLLRSVWFSFSENKGKLMENLVYLQLRREKQPIFYYKTKTNCEVDFFLPKERTLIQVTQYLDGQTQAREVKALTEANDELKEIKEIIIITEGEKGLFQLADKQVRVLPLYEWLLKD